MMTREEAKSVASLCHKLARQARQEAKNDGEELGENEIANIEGIRGLADRVLEKREVPRDEAEWVLSVMANDDNHPGRDVLSRICAN